LLVPTVPASGDGASVAQLGNAALALEASARALNSLAIPFDPDMSVWVVILVQVLF
jgi:hypothetical protein